MEKRNNDFRKSHPIIIHAKKQGKTIALDRLEIFKFNKATFEFATPNIISIFLNISHKAYITSIKSYGLLIKPMLKERGTVKFENEDLTALYDYLETSKVAVIFAYNAVEAFANIAIPEKYLFETKNNKGVKEVWDKEAIQKWMSTSQKLITILPELRKVDNPQSQGFWSDFKNLENIRNEIIHPKQLSKENNVTNEIHKQFFDERIFKWITSTKDVLNFFCKGECSEAYFPKGIGPNNLRTHEIDDFDEYFKKKEE